MLLYTGTEGNASESEHRGVEQLEARRAHNPEVVGSSPASATKTVTVFDTISNTVIFYLCWNYT